MIRGENITKWYRDLPVLDGVSFTLEPGITCLMAPSGAGKTTLLRILLGLERPDSGTISGLEGLRISSLFQEDRLLLHLSAEENLRFVLGERFCMEDARNLLAELGLTPPLGQPVREFSGGMRRRVALARALAAPFELLLLDEPFAGLDEENRVRAMECIRRRSGGKTVLLVTHDPEDAAGLPILRLDHK